MDLTILISRRRSENLSTLILKCKYLKITSTLSQTAPPMQQAPPGNGWIEGRHRWEGSLRPIRSIKDSFSHLCDMETNMIIWAASRKVILIMGIPTVQEVMNIISQPSNLTTLVDHRYHSTAVVTIPLDSTPIFHSSPMGKSPSIRWIIKQISCKLNSTIWCTNSSKWRHFIKTQPSPIFNLRYNLRMNFQLPPKTILFQIVSTNTMSSKHKQGTVQAALGARPNLKKV